MRRAPARLGKAFLLTLGAASVACRAPDPKQELAVSAFETYWAIARSAGENRYVAPAVRFELRPKGESPLRSVQASAVFRHQGEDQEWGSAFQQLIVPRKPLPQGKSLPVLLTSDTHYFTDGPPEGIFDHERFKDARVEVFLRVGSSGWVKFGEAAIERRIGSRSVPQELR